MKRKFNNIYLLLFPGIDILFKEDISKKCIIQVKPMLKKNKYSKEHLIKDVRWLKKVVALIGTILGIILGINKLVQSQFGALTNSVSADFLLQISMIILFFSFIYAARADADLVELVGTKPPRVGVLSPEGIGLIILLTAIYIFLWFSDGVKEFSLFLGAFWFLNFIGWHLTAKKALQNTFKYEQDEDIDIIERIKLVENHMTGRWQRNRFLLGFLLYGILIVSTVSDLYLKVSFAGFSPEFVISLYIFLCLIFLLGWMWIKRISVTIALGTIESMARNYHFMGKKEYKKFKELNKE